MVNWQPLPLALAGAEIPLLGDLVLLGLVAVVLAIVLTRLKLPVIAGLLVAGALMGPNGLGAVAHGENLNALAETGVVLLLFTIGLEFSLSRLKRIGTTAAAAGLLQVGLTLAAAGGIALLLGESLPRAVFWGMVFALSSTAIVLRSLGERNEIDAPHGRLVLSTLITQDLAIVPFVLAVPLLAGGSLEQAGFELLFILFKAVVLILVAVVLARFVIPRVMLAIDATNSRELFLMAVLVIGVGMAWATMKIGLSPALGAFLAGIVLADTDFQQRALAEVLPLRDVFTAFFFIIMGMLFDWRYVFSHPGAVLGLFALILIGKWLIAAWSVQLMRFPARVALLAGLGLAQFGEFGYVLLQTGSDNGLINGGEKALILCAGLLSMFATPSLIKLAPHITAGERLLKPLERLLGVRGIEHCDEDDTQLSGHVIIAGFGPGGRMLAQSLATSGVPYIVFELNAETVRRERTQGEPVYYADISSAEALHHARAGEARAIVLLINDHQAVLRALDTVRSHAPRAVAVVRCRYAAERPQLEARGAALVVVEELEASFEVVSELYDILGKPVPEFYPFPGSSALGLGLAEPAGGEEDHGDSERSQ